MADKIEIKSKKAFEGEKKIERTKTDAVQGGCDYCECDAKDTDKDDE